LKIFVCVKQVPGVSEVKIDPKTNTLVREGILSIINPNDRNAIELALTLKEKHGAEVVVLSMGPPQAEEILREALAMGVDKGYQAIDGDTGQVPPELAEELGIPQIAYVLSVELNGDKIVAERKFRAVEIVVIETKLPALISVLNDINKPRYPSMAGIMKAHDDSKIIHFDAIALNADKSKIGLNGSNTEVWKIFSPERKGDHIILKGTLEEMVQKLCQNLKNDKIF